MTLFKNAVPPIVIHPLHSEAALLFPNVYKFYAKKKYKIYIAYQNSCVKDDYYLTEYVNLYL